MGGGGEKVTGNLKMTCRRKHVCNSVYHRNARDCNAEFVLSNYVTMLCVCGWEYFMLVSTTRNRVDDMSELDISFPDLFPLVTCLTLRL